MVDGIDFKTDALKNLIKAMKKTGQKVRIGINDPKEAAIGAAHEFGTSTIPQRSFLKMPLQMFLEKKLLANNDFDEEAMKQVIKTQRFRPWLDKVAKASLEVVQESFDTGGFGLWLADKDMAHKQTKKVLIETGKLRGSIVTEIVE